METSVRILGEADAEAYRALRLRGLRTDPEAFGRTYEEDVARPIESTRERIRAQVPADGSFTLGAFDASGACVGVVTVLRADGRKQRHRASVYGMYVAPEARGSGVGRRLLLEAIAMARRVPELEQLHLAVVTTNVAARRLYASLGFVAYGIEPRALKLGDQTWDEELSVLSLR